eukprot:c17816_g1_i1.p1 GENE.c17816_g1_i1~~c17816_g1_i1.p1  ORF type:complete len:135 (+),score=24.47 c17816_g1_i1:33-407(+)
MDNPLSPDSVNDTSDMLFLDLQDDQRDRDFLAMVERTGVNPFSKWMKYGRPPIKLWLSLVVVFLTTYQVNNFNRKKYSSKILKNKFKKIEAVHHTDCLNYIYSLKDSRKKKISNFFSVFSIIPG